MTTWPISGRPCWQAHRLLHGKASIHIRHDELKKLMWVWKADRKTISREWCHSTDIKIKQCLNLRISAHPNIVCVRFNLSSVLKVWYIEAMIRGFEGGYLSRSSISSERREGCFEKCHGLKNWRFRLELKGWPNVCLPSFRRLATFISV